MRVTRKLLCTILLVLFTLEYVAATTSHPASNHPGHQTQLVTPEIQAHFALLAEESEERDHRDSDVLIVERFLAHPALFPLLHPGKLRHSISCPAVSRTVPKYTLHRSILI